MLSVQLEPGFTSVKMCYNWWKLTLKQTWIAEFRTKHKHFLFIYYIIIIIMLQQQPPNISQKSQKMLLLCLTAAVLQLPGQVQVK
jgi:hypothetical protein